MFMSIANDVVTCQLANGTMDIPAMIHYLVTLDINAIKIVVPILLIIFGMLDLGKAVMAQKEDEIKKGQQMFIKRLITAVIVFLVFFIVQLVVGLVSSDASVTSCAQCFINADESACRVVQ